MPRGVVKGVCLPERMWFCFFCSAVSGACGLLLLPDPFGELPPVPSSEGADIVFYVGCFWVVVAEHKRGWE